MRTPWWDRAVDSDRVFVSVIAGIVGLAILGVGFGLLQQDRIDNECRARDGVPVRGRNLTLCLAPEAVR